MRPCIVALLATHDTLVSGGTFSLANLSWSCATTTSVYFLTAIKELLPMQPGDVPATFADVEDLKADIGFEPKTSIEDGVRRFVAWYRDYHHC